MFIKHRRWVIIIVLLFGIMLFNLPTEPKNGLVVYGGEVEFDWIGQAEYALVDNNNMFVSPIVVNKKASVQLEPGVYYWKVSGLGVVSEFEISSLLAVDISKENGEDYVENVGNVDAEVDLKKSAGMISGSFVLETDHKKKINDVEEVIVSLFEE